MMYRLHDYSSILPELWPIENVTILTLLHSERPKLYTILAFLSAIGLSLLNIQRSIGDGDLELGQPIGDGEYIK